MRWNGKRIVRWCHRNPNIAKNFERNSYWRKFSMIMVWERYCNATPKPEFFLFSLFIFSFLSQLILVRLDWNFHRWFSIQKQVNWCTIDSFILKFCTSQHSYPVPLMTVQIVQGLFNLATISICNLNSSLRIRTERSRGIECITKMVYYI